MSFTVRISRWWLLPAFAVGMAGGYYGGRPASVESERLWITDQRGGGSKSKLAESGSMEIVSARIATLERIAASGREDLVELSRELLGVERGPKYLGELMDRWIEVDARAGLEFFEGEGATNLSALLARVTPGNFCGRWALVDPQAAVLAAEGMDPDGKAIAMDRMADALAGLSPDEYLRLHADCEPTFPALSTRMEVLSLAQSDPSAAVAMFESLADGGSKSLATALASEWAKHDPQAAIDWAHGLGKENGSIAVLDAIAARLLDSDPDRAAEIFKEGIAARNEAREMTGSIPSAMRSTGSDWVTAARVMSESDPAAAMAWVSKHFPDQSMQLIGDLIPQDAVAAVEALAALPESMLYEGRITFRAGQHWRPLNIDAAIERLQEVENVATRESIHAWLLGAMAEEDPSTAITVATAEFSEAANRALVLEKGMATWARQDLTAASEWLATRPVGADTDNAIVGLLQAAPLFEPSAALAWAGEIRDQGSRINQLSLIYGNWKVEDENGARAAFRALDLSDEEARELQQRGVNLY